MSTVTDGKIGLRGQVADVCKVDGVVADILLSRGVDTPEAAHNFLYGNDRLFHDPFLLDGMRAAAARIDRAVSSGEPIMIVGDSDSDGITATASLIMYLRSIGAKADYCIPAAEESSSFWNDVRPEFIESGIRLIVTVDCGISSIKSVEPFSARNIDIIITDHHESKDTLPAAFAIVDPKRQADYPMPSLSGAGVALKLICALAEGRGDAYEQVKKYCDLVAIGTVADAMPLTDENRFIVKTGLRQIGEQRRVGLDALLRSAGYNLERAVTASSTGFVIAPRLNAAGRADRSELAVELLMTGNHSEARTLAEKLAELNRERQQLESVSIREATRLVESGVDLERDRLIVLRVENWPTGIAGIVASRLVDRYSLPCVIISFSDGIGRGSGRSVKGFDMFSAIRENAAILREFGGHELAAGFTVCDDNFDALRASLKAQAARAYAENGYAMLLPVSAEIPAADITMPLARQLAHLEPYGVGNPQPLFSTTEVLLDEVLSLANARHLRLTLRKDGRTFTGLIFGHTVRELKCTTGDLVDMVYAIDIGVGRSGDMLQLIIKKMDVSACCLTEDYEREYTRFISGELDVLPPQAMPDRKDVIDVYSYLLRTMGEADAGVPRYQSVMARRVSRTFDKTINYSQLMLSLGVLSELKMVEINTVGRQIQVSVNCCNKKKNLSESALWRRLKG